MAALTSRALHRRFSCLGGLTPDGGAVRGAIEKLPVSEDSPAACANIRELLE